jgi:preprotein translocase subunit SecD
MRPFNRRFFLIALASLLSISVSAADGMIVAFSSATTDHDKRGNPVLRLIFSEASGERLRTFSTENIGQKVELRVAGNLIFTPVLREPLMGSTVEIWNVGWTDQTVADLAQKLSNAPNGEIEFRPSSPPN